MISIAHAVTGAFIASTLPNPLVFIPLVLISHFALDYIQHYDLGVAMKKQGLRLPATIILTFLDLAIAFLLVAWLYQQSPTHLTWQIWLGAFFAILPDIIEATDLFFHQPLKILGPFYHFHEKYHHSTKNIFWGLLPQVIVVAAITLLVIFN